MKKSLLRALVLCIFSLPLHAASPSNDYKEIDWRILRTLDYKTGTKPAELAALDQKGVKVPGFVVPLEDNGNGGLTEFLLVPSPQACIHVPPPPPNQMILVKMPSGILLQRMSGPVWILGKISISSTDSQYGKVSYLLQGDTMLPYEVETSR